MNRLQALFNVFFHSIKAIKSLQFIEKDKLKKTLHGEPTYIRRMMHGSYRVSFDIFKGGDL